MFLYSLLDSLFISFPVSDVLVLIPTYNEIENIERVLARVYELPKAFHVLVIDDGSPDGTADKVRELMASDYEGKLFLEERAGKLGLGTAYIHGFKWAMNKGYDYVIEMDADLSHPPEKLPELYHACAQEGFDVSVGSRYVEGGGVKNWPKDRILLSKYASIYVRMVTWMPIKDTTAGFVCYSKEVLNAIDLEKIRFVGYAFQIEMKFAAWQLGYRIKEVPIVFVDREFGQSKMSMKIFREALLGVISLRWSGFFNSYAK